MRRTIMLLAAAAPFVAAGVTSADAKCTRLAFSVNDYGKEGPIKDAKELLDKHIAEQMAQKGIAKYTVGKKDVSCELFIDLIVFDEHTCRAEANVCWNEGAQGAPKSASGETLAVGQVPSAKGVDKAKQAAAPAKEKAAAAKIELAPGFDETATPPAAEAKAAPSPVTPAAAPSVEVEAAAPSPSMSVAAEPEPLIPEPPEPPDAAIASDEKAIPDAVETAEPASGSADASQSETGSIERFAAPKNIVPPAPVEANRSSAAPR